MLDFEYPENAYHGIVFFMTIAQMQKIQKIALESASLAKRALRKSNELEAYLSLLEYKAGNINTHTSVRALFRKIKRA